jgi:hypothetical protein
LKHVRKSIEGAMFPLFKTALLERAVFRAVHLTGEDRTVNVTAITNEPLRALTQLAEEAAL